MEITNKIMRICSALDDKKAVDISIINISKNSSVADHFILATATSITHARTLSDVVCEKLPIGEQVFKVDGHGQVSWISLDVGDVVVHIFTKEVREHYSLEKLWADSKNHKKFSDIKKDLEKKAKTAAKKVKEVKSVKKEDKPKKEKETKQTKEIKAKAVKKEVKVVKPAKETKKVAEKPKSAAKVVKKAEKTVKKA